MLKEIHEQPEALRQSHRRPGDAATTGSRSTELAGLEDAPAHGRPGSSSSPAAARTTRRSSGRPRSRTGPASRPGPPSAPSSATARRRSTSTTLVIAVTQSGETADTIAPTRLARERGCPIIAVTNTVGSAITREADAVLFLQAGPEIAVAASQDVRDPGDDAGHPRGGDRQGPRHARAPSRSWSSAPRLRALPAGGRSGRSTPRPASADARPPLRQLARASCSSAAATRYPAALEGALKLKEVSYVHAEGYAAGELKHGPISLLDAECPLVAVATRSSVYDKLISNVMEGRARDARVIAVATEGDAADRALRRRRLLGPRHARGAQPGPGDHPAPAVRLPHRRSPAARTSTSRATSPSRSRSSSRMAPDAVPARDASGGPVSSRPGRPSSGSTSSRSSGSGRRSSGSAARFSDRVLTAAERRYVRDRPGDVRRPLGGQGGREQGPRARRPGDRLAGHRDRAAAHRPARRPPPRPGGGSGRAARDGRGSRSRSPTSRTTRSRSPSASGPPAAGTSSRSTSRSGSTSASGESWPGSSGCAAVVAEADRRLSRRRGPPPKRDRSASGGGDRRRRRGSRRPPEVELLDDRIAAALLPERPVRGHKGTFGKLLVLAGSLDYAGAALLVCRAAGRAGAGLVTLAVPESLQPLFAAKVVEATTMALPEDDVEEVDPEPALARILDHEHDAIVVGSGAPAGPGDRRARPRSAVRRGGRRTGAGGRSTRRRSARSPRWTGGGSGSVGPAS